jgi:hypothetical protein
VYGLMEITRGDRCMVNTFGGKSLSVAAFTLGLTLRLASAGFQDAPGSSKDLMPIARVNEIVQARCVVCHDDGQRPGGLSFQHFDAAHADPVVARMMAIKVSQDGAMTAAGGPRLDPPVAKAFVEWLGAIAAAAPVGAWAIDLTIDPLMPGQGHSLVTARLQSQTGNVLITCHAATRRAQIEVSAPGAATSPAAFGFEGMSPAMRQLFSWCLEGAG